MPFWLTKGFTGTLLSGKACISSCLHLTQNFVNLFLIMTQFKKMFTTLIYILTDLKQELHKIPTFMYNTF